MSTFDEYFKYNGIDHRFEFATQLKNCEQKILRTSNDPDVGIFYKPKTKGTRFRRNCKEQIYKLAAQLARESEIKGDMISLGAAYALEIYKEFSSSIENRFTNVEKDKESYLQLADYYYRLKHDQALFHKVDDKTELNNVYLMKADILNVLALGKVSNLGIIDLDFMRRLDRELIDSIYTALQGPVVHKDRFLLAIWSTYGRSCTENDYDYSARPYLFWKFVLNEKSRYTLSGYKTFKYCDNHIPLKVELLVLDNKKKCSNPLTIPSTINY